MNIQEFFALGMKRNLPALYEPPVIRRAINLGAGNHAIPGTVPYDYPSWDADTTPIPEKDGSVDIIHAYHFLEHVADPIAMLRELQRVLAVGGVANIVVPHYLGSMAYHDFTHRRLLAIDVWKNLLNQPYYAKDRDGWKLREHLSFGMFVVERNIAIFTQLVRLP